MRLAMFRNLLPGGYPDWVRRGMFMSVVEACLFAVWFNLVGGNFMTGLALHLGAGGFELGLLGALPPLTMLVQVLSAPYVAGVRYRRRFIMVLAAIQRCLWAGAGLVALALPAGTGLRVYLIMFTLSWVAVAPVVVAWQSYMSDVVPLEVRGRYMGLRQALHTSTGMVALLAGGALLDLFPGATGFRVLGVLALAAALGNTFAWGLHPDVPPADAPAPRRPFWATILAPLRRPGPHRRSLLFFALWAFAQNLAVPFYSVALIQDLGLSFSAASLLTGAAAAATVLTSQVWGRLVDRRGEGRVAGALMLLLASVPVLFTSARWLGWPVLLLAHVLHGSAFGGMQLATLSLNMKLAPGQDRSVSLAAFGAAGGLAGFLSPLLAGPLTAGHLGMLFTAASLLSAAVAAVWWGRAGAAVRAATAPE